jgi:hypothetical protein
MRGLTVLLKQLTVAMIAAASQWRRRDWNRDGRGSSPHAGGLSAEQRTQEVEGNAYVTGSTSSNDFPTTANAFQSKPPGTSAHPFVAKLNATGTALVYATYLGGGDLYDSSAAIAGGDNLAAD